MNLINLILNIVWVLVTIAVLLIFFAWRTTVVQKAGTAALLMIVALAIIVPFYGFGEPSNLASAKIEQHREDLQRGAKLYSTYCVQCHGDHGQGLIGPQLNGQATNGDPAKVHVQTLSDDEINRTISAGRNKMPFWADLYGGPLRPDDIAYLVALIRSSNPAYEKKNGLPENFNGFTSTDVREFTPVVKLVTPTATPSGPAATPTVAPTPVTLGATHEIILKDCTASQPDCQPAFYDPISAQVKVGTTVTWINQSGQIHTVTSTDDPTKGPNGIFDSTVDKPIVKDGKFSYTFSKPGMYKYFCQFHPTMVAFITVVA